jgi:hypothetical protein
MRIIKEGKNTNGVLDKVYIAYGSSEYSPDKFRSVDLNHWRNAVNNKPFGGLWASPIDSKWGWKDWCQAEEWNTESLNTYFTFTLAPGTNIYVIDNEKDLMSVSTFRSEYMPTLSIDFAGLINNGYDGIYVTDTAARKFHHSTIYGISDLNSWDCESICIFNKNVIIPTMKTNKEIVRISESDLHNLIKESISEILEEKDFIKYPKYPSPYDDKKIGNGVSQPVKNTTDLYDIRARIGNVLYALREKRPDDARKQLLRLYKLVDAMINQGF